MSLPSSGQISILDIKNACVEATGGPVNISSGFTATGTFGVTTVTVTDLQALTAAVYANDSMMNNAAPYGMDEFYGKTNSETSILRYTLSHYGYGGTYSTEVVLTNASPTTYTLSRSTAGNATPTLILLPTGTYPCTITRTAGSNNGQSGIVRSPNT
jgi:hypothetical protein